MCDKMIKKVKYFIDYFKYLENPIQALLFKFKFKNSYEAKVKGFPGCVRFGTDA